MCGYRDNNSFSTRRSSDLNMVKVEEGKIGREIIVEENPFSRWLFTNTTSAWIWLILRLYLGYSWLTARSEEHTSELQSRGHLVCRLLLEEKKILSSTHTPA